MERPLRAALYLVAAGRGSTCCPLAGKTTEAVTKRGGTREDHGRVLRGVIRGREELRKRVWMGSLTTGGWL